MILNHKFKMKKALFVCMSVDVCACFSVWVCENLAAQYIHIYVHVLRIGVSNSRDLSALSVTILTPFVFIRNFVFSYTSSFRDFQELLICYSLTIRRKVAVYKHFYSW